MSMTIGNEKEIVYRYRYKLIKDNFRKFMGERIPSIVLFQAEEFIPLRRIKIETAHDPYGLHPDFRMYFEPLLNELYTEFTHSKYYNNALAKLLDFNYNEKTKKGHIKIGRSYFFYEWLVHLNPDRAFYTSSPFTFRDRFDPLLISELNEENSHLEKSPLVNTLGINGLIFTRDGYIIVQRRSRAVGLERQTFSVSFGGVFHWEFDKNSASKMIAEVVSQNIEDELGIIIEPEDLHQSTYLMGIDRSLKYFGKPDIYVFTPIQESIKEIEIKRSIDVEDFIFIKVAKNVNQILNDPIRVRSRITTFTDNLTGKVSLHLKIALDMLDKILMHITPL